MENNNNESPSPEFLDWSFKAGYGTCTSDITLALWDAWQAGQKSEEAQSLALECALKRGELDAREGVTLPPAEFLEDTKASRMLREAWLRGWHSTSQGTTQTH